jgi:hypothetical protein
VSTVKWGGAGGQVAVAQAAGTHDPAHGLARVERRDVPDLKPGGVLAWSCS